MAQSHFSTMSCNTTSTAPPWSVNYVTAYTRRATASTAVSRPNSQPNTVLYPPCKTGKRALFRAKAERAFTSAKKGLKFVSTLVKSGRRGSETSATSDQTMSRADSRLSVLVPQSVIETSAKRSSTLSVHVANPTYKGSNVRLSIHQAPPTPKASQTVIPTYGDSAVRLSVHQVPPTPEVSQKTSLDTEDSPVSNEVPSLPYIAFVPAVQLDISRRASTIETNEPFTEEQAPAPAAAILATKEVSHPNTLTIGVGMPLSGPRTTIPRPHTTGELLPTANLLPYIAYNPRFNPYDRSPSPTPSRTPTQTTSASDLAAAFAEAEAAEQVVRHKRHTTLYADLEAGLVLEAIPAAAPTPTPAHQIRRKPVPTASETATAAPTPEPVAAPAPEPTPTPAPAPAPAAVLIPAPLKVRTSKPLPPSPSATSPRRYTYGIVQPHVAAKDDDITAPMMSLMRLAGESERSKVEEIQRKDEGRRFKGLRRLLRKLRPRL